jgi:hypothetical protein
LVPNTPDGTIPIFACINSISRDAKTGKALQRVVVDMMEWRNDIKMLTARYLAASEEMEMSGPVAWLFGLRGMLVKTRRKRRRGTRMKNCGWQTEGAMGTIVMRGNEKGERNSAGASTTAKPNLGRSRGEDEGFCEECRRHIASIYS